MRERLSAIGLAASLLVGAVVGLAPGTAAAAVTPAGQVITVSAANSTTTWATVDVWQLQPDGRYFRVQHYPDARIGAAGIGAASESISKTPTGLHRLGQAFGVQPDPGVAVPYIHVGLNDVWTGSTGSVINEHGVCAPYTCPPSYGAFERRINYPQQYAYGAVIGYNMAAPYGTGAVAGKGSAFFLHVQNAYVTSGCVAVNQARLPWILRWLRAAQNPVISLGIGVAPYSVIPNRYH